MSELTYCNYWVFVAAVLGADAWDGSDSGPPAGYDKDALTHRWNPASKNRPKYTALAEESR